MTRVIVVGAGHAGVSLVSRLRTQGFTGEVTLIGDEPHLPYQRPPLSKDYLLGTVGSEKLWLRSREFYQDNRIDLRLGHAVTAIDTAARAIVAGGETLFYDELVFTTGVEARRLPAEIGGDLPGVHALNRLVDVDAVRPEFLPGRRLLIVGGGYIGLEAAAAGAKLGLRVTLIQSAERLLRRAVGSVTSDHLRALHLSHGVEIHEGVGLEALGGEGRVTSARLSNGREILVDLVIVGIGSRPAMRLAERAGCVLEDGIRTDAYGRTSVPHVWAAGDCASFPYRNGRTRLECVANANDQAELVAANIMGAERPYAAKPWFWSNQFDCRLQIAGLNTGHDREVARQTEPGRVSVWYYAGDRLLAVDALNEPRAYMVAMRLLEQGRSPAPGEVETVGDLRDLLR